MDMTPVTMVIYCTCESSEGESGKRWGRGGVNGMIVVFQSLVSQEAGTSIWHDSQERGCHSSP